MVTGRCRGAVHSEYLIATLLFVVFLGVSSVRVNVGEEVRDALLSAAIPVAGGGSREGGGSCDIGGSKKYLGDGGGIGPNKCGHSAGAPPPPNDTERPIGDPPDIGGLFGDGGDDGGGSGFF